MNDTSNDGNSQERQIRLDQTSRYRHRVTHVVCQTVLLLVLLLSGCSLATTESFKRQVDRPEQQKELKPVHHIVLVWMKPEVKTEQQRKVILLSAVILRKIPGLGSLSAGTAVQSQRPIVDDSFDVGFHMVFDSKAAVNRYLKHPAHVGYVNSIRPLIDKLLIDDFTTP